MKKAIKVTYEFDDGSKEEYFDEQNAWDAAWNIDWVEKGTKRKIPHEVIDRLNNLDPNIFPDNLFEEE